METGTEEALGEQWLDGVETTWMQHIVASGLTNDGMLCRGSRSPWILKKARGREDRV